MSEREKKAGTVPAATASTEKKEVAVVRMLGGGTRQVRSHFHFDDVLTSFSTQSDVFAATLDPLVDEVLAGYEATAFAYGQTGTGKTYTMEGDLGSDAGRGLVPRTAAALIERLNKGKYADYSISCSYLEIYNEELSDLLAPPHMQQCRLDLKDVGNGRGVVCTGLSEVSVSGLADILELVRAAQERRRVAETRVNARSSRSHCIFTLRVKCRRMVAAGELENSGKLHLVDLAGSECAKKASATFTPNEENLTISGSYDKRNAWTNVSSEEDRERKNINQSLLTLGRVISALRDGSGRIPYRDSKLTRLLQDALGGRCKTVIIATISPALNAVEETISTLSYAEQACGVKNRPVATSLLRTIRLAANGGPPHAAEVTAAATTNGISSSDWAELEMKVAYLTQEVEEAQAALAAQYREVEEQTEKAMVAEANLREVLNEREELEFLYDSLGEFTDGRLEAEQSLKRALDDTWTRGSELRQLVFESQEKAAGARLQARVAVDTAATTAATLSKALRESASTVQQLAKEAYMAHKSSTDAAAEMTSEEEAANNELRSKIGEAMAEMKSFMETLGTEAHASLQELQQQISSKTAFAQSGAADVEAGAVGLEGEVQELRSKSEEQESEVTRGLKELLGSLSTSLREGFDAASMALEEAQCGALKEMEARMKCLRDRVQEPVEELSKALGKATKQGETVVKGVQSLEEEAAKHCQSGAARASTLEQSLTSAQERHRRECLEQQAALSSKHEELTSSFDRGTSKVKESLDALGISLHEASDRLKKGSAGSRKHCEEALEASRLGLEDAWRRQSEALETLGTDLDETKNLQIASNVGSSLAQELRETSSEHEKVTQEEIERLKEARGEVMREVDELKAQKKSEEEAIALLRQQREALEADVSKLRRDFESLSKSLEEGRGQIRDIVQEQTLSRKKVLETISKALEEELKGLGGSLEKATDSLSERLSQSEQTLNTMSAEAQQMMERSNTTSDALQRVVEASAAVVQKSATKLQATQETVETVEAHVLQAQQQSSQKLENSAKTCERWGKQSEEVAVRVQSAITSTNSLRSSVGESAKAWEAQRQTQAGHIKEWAQEMDHVHTDLAAVAGQGETTKKHISELREQAHSNHEELRVLFEQSGVQAEERNSQLASIGKMHEEHRKERASEEAERAESMAKLRSDAIALSEALTQRTSENAKISQNLKEEVEQWPVGLQATNTKLIKIDEETKALSKTASDRLTEAKEGLEKAEALRAENSEKFSSSVGQTCSALQQTATKLQTTAEEIQRGLELGDTSIRDSLGTANEAQKQLSENLRTAISTAEQATTTARKRGCQRVLIELQRGEQTQKRSIEEASHGCEGAAANLHRYVQSMRSSLSTAPLAAFDDFSEPALPDFVEKIEVSVAERPTKEHLLKNFTTSKNPAYEGKENVAELPSRSQLEPTVGPLPVPVCKDKKKESKDGRTVLSEIRGVCS